VHKKVHFIGIGGIGVSALARYFLAQKWVVTGSDLVNSTLIEGLQKEGVLVKIGSHQAENVPKSLNLAVYSPAVEDSNLELQDVKKRSVSVLSYPEAVARIARNYAFVAVAGTHGKSTTTAMLSIVMERAGLDPTVLVGTQLKEFGGSNFRSGKGTHLVVEADEYGGSFLEYSPSYAIITNIDKDHLDYYKTYDGVKRAFLEFIGNVCGGALVLNEDDAGLQSLRSQIEEAAKKNDTPLLWYSLEDPIAGGIKDVLHIPGAHNVSNAMAVYTLARELGVSEADILKALGLYAGAWRRMELRGEMRPGVLVYDDYAHHPVEIRATFGAFREKYPDYKIVCVYQPHQAKRLEVLFDDFIDAFEDVDELVLLPIYQVAGRDRIAEEFTQHQFSREKTGVGFTSKALAEKIEKKHAGVHVMYCDELKDIRGVVEEVLGSDQSPAVVVMTGAGDVVEYTELLL
jgi:UDP-N-acetylmuramate--alanine ligase